VILHNLYQTENQCHKRTVICFITEDESGTSLTLRNRIKANIVVNSLAYENPINEQLVPLVGQMVGQSETGHGATQLPVKNTGRYTNRR